MDPGSILLASTLATTGGTIVLWALERERLPSELLALGGMATRAGDAALAAGVVLLLAWGALWGLAFAAVWLLTGWPIAPFQATLMSVAPWAIGRVVRGSVRPHAMPALAAHLAYGALLGATYHPGT